MHRLTAREFEKEIQERYGNIEFPEPPYAGNNAISPIAVAIDLYNEGKDMHHCVAAFCEKVVQGECYFYRITSPERATLELVRDGKEWHVGQIKLAVIMSLPTKLEPLWKSGWQSAGSRPKKNPEGWNSRPVYLPLKGLMYAHIKEIPAPASSRSPNTQQSLLHIAIPIPTREPRRYTTGASQLPHTCSCSRLTGTG